MPSLYEIDRAISDVIETGYHVDEDTGEVLFDSSDLDALGVALSEKLDACGRYIKNQRALAESIKLEERALAERRKEIEHRIDSMDGYVLSTVNKLEGKRFESPAVRFTTRRSTATVIDDDSQIPDEYKDFVTTAKVDRKALGQALKRGDRIPGARLEERLNLQVK